MQSAYTIEIWHPSPTDDGLGKGELVADISRLCTSRSFTVRRNRPSTIELQLSLREAEDLARDLGMDFYHLFAVGRAEVRIRRGERYLVDGQIIYTDPTLDENSETFSIRASGFLDIFASKYLWLGDSALSKEQYVHSGHVRAAGEPVATSR